MTSLPFIEGDRCVDVRGNTGSVRKCLNRSTRQYFLGVYILAGPDKGTWGKAYHFRPLLDLEGGTIPAICVRCDRPFRSRPRTLQDLGGMVLARDSRCATCQGVRGVQPAERDADGYVGSEAWKTKHHSRDDGRGDRS